MAFAKSQPDIETTDDIEFLRNSLQRSQLAIDALEGVISELEEVILHISRGHLPTELLPTYSGAVHHATKAEQRRKD